MERTRDVRSFRVCAKVLRANYDSIVSALFGESGRDIENRFQDSAEQLRQRVRDSLDFLIKHFEGNADFGAIYAGQRNFELTNLQRTRAENLEACRRSVQRDGEIYRQYLARHVTNGELKAFESEYGRITRGLVNDASRHVRTLFIGDCMISEILSFVVGPLADEGLSIEPFAINPRDVGQLHRILKDITTKQFDVIFFSPFSHGRLAEVKALLASNRAFSSRAEFQALIESIIDQTQLLLDEISKRFECPIFVHNAGFVVRATSMAKSVGRLLLTYRARNLAARRINRWLADYVATTNAATVQHLFLIDETDLVRKFGRCALGQYLSTSGFLHSVVLSQRLAREYRLRITAVGHLMDKKVVVCDLDNTLWKGTIGDGPVVHCLDRQSSLRRLKDHSGVVLSIASKNEPAYVHFQGGVLNSSDFVAPQISWTQKSNSIATIRSTLNLQIKHMVFLDGRPEERALVRETFPDLLALDPNEPVTWELIDLWCEMAYGSSDIDRTRLYQNQALRDSFTEARPTDNADGGTLKKLDLIISISQAKRGDLKRVAELVNRTNQWNLCGSRTSFAQVREWHTSSTASIFVANVADRFGDMGLVCVAVVTQQAERVEIPLFVLSCRVFGYGVESAMLAEIARRSEVQLHGKSLIGHYRSTAQNHPCRNMYSDHGFALEDGGFRWDGTTSIPEVPWADVRSLA